jgi:hypothetical protein
MLSTLLIAATPAAAVDPLKWNYGAGWMYFEGSWWNQYPGSDVVDFTVSQDGMTFYAATRVAGTVSAVVTLLFVDGGDTLTEHFTFTYVDQDGNPGNAGTVTIGVGAIIGAGGAVALAGFDTGVLDITAIAAGAPMDATAGTFNILGPLGVMGTYDVATATFTDGVAGASLTSKLFKGTMGGAAWTDITSPTNYRLPATLDSLDFVAASPDNPDVVVVLDAGGADGTIAAAATKDGGLNWSDMGTITGGNGDITAAYDLDVSPISSGNIYYVAIAGMNAADAAVYFYNFGAAVGAWRDAVADFGGTLVPPGTDPAAMWAAVTPTACVPDDFRAVQFSFNFGSDFSVLCISEDLTSGIMWLHIFSLASHKWDKDLNLLNYPVPVDDDEGAGIASIEAASIATGPDFMGIDEDTLVVFVGAAITAATSTGGIYRVDETGYVTKIKNVGIFSVAFDGTTVVAGSYDTNNVYRVLDVTANQPTAASARSLKKIGVDNAGNDLVIVHIAGANTFGAKSGAASAMSKSTDYGYTWNDFYFMDSSNAPMDDILVSPDGSVLYMAAHDLGQASVYRSVGMSVQRVLCVDGAIAFMLRGIPGDPNVVYVGAKAASGITDIYVTTDGGVTRWSRKTTFPGTAINDMTVESATVVYVANGVMVYKSTNSGSLWGTGVDTKLAGGIFNLVALGDGKLVAGGNVSGVAFSTDGAATWTPTFGVMDEFAPMYVTATGLGATDTIFAASSASDAVYKGPAAFFGEFKSMHAPATGNLNKGIALEQGVLYVLQDDGTIIHSLTPTLSPHTEELWGTPYMQAGLAMGVTPGSSLQVSASGTSIKLWAINTAFSWVYYFEDIVSLNAPTLNAPADGELVQIVSTTLADATTVVFSWNRASSRLTEYYLWIAKDADFTEILDIAAIASTGPSSIVTAIYTRSPLFPMFNPGETYYWKVMVSEPFSGIFSETRSFTVAPSAATVPEIGAPINGATDVGTKPAFSWTPVTGTTKYQFQMDTGTTFTAPMIDEQVTTTAYMVTVVLEEGKTYFWRVKALEPIESDWSVVASFVVAVPPPPPTTPIITVPPAPTVVVTIPPAQTVVIPPATTQEVAPVYIWAVIIIGGVLVIAVIVLIVRTRRPMG